MRVLIVTAVIALSIVAPSVAGAQDVVMLGAAGAIVELDDEDRTELQVLRSRSHQATISYVGALVAGALGVAAVSVGAATHTDEIAGIVALSVGSALTLVALVSLAAAIGFDVGSSRDRWLRDNALVVDLVLGPSEGQPSLTGTF